MISKILKSKNGSFLLLGVIIIPIIIALALTLIGSGMRERNMKITYQASLDNEAYALAMEFGETYYETSAKNENEMEFCLFKDEDLDTINTRFQIFFENLDGWNPKWVSQVTIVNNVNHSINANVPESTEFIKIKAKIVLPNTNCDSYDKYYNDNQNSWDKVSKNIPDGFEGTSNNSVKVLYFTSYGSITGKKHIHNLTTVITKEATCQTPQETLTYCTKCGQYFTLDGQKTNGPVVGEPNPEKHTLVSYYFTSATCTEKSYSLIKCSEKNCTANAQQFFANEIDKTISKSITLPIYSVYGISSSTDNSLLPSFELNPQYSYLSNWLTENKGVNFNRADSVLSHLSFNITASDVRNMEVYEFAQLLRYYSTTNNSIFNATLNAGWIKPMSEKINHNFYYQNTILSTCKDEGYDIYQCINCKAIENLNYKPRATTGADHNLVKVDYVAKTCTSDGNKAYYYCTKCNKYFISENGYDLSSDLYDTVSLTKFEVSEQDTIIPKSHNYDYDVNTQTGGTVILPTCTTKGFTIVKCKDCSDYYYTNYTNIDYSKPAHNRIIKIDGNNVSNDEVENLTKYEAVASTCTTNGNYEYYKCSACENYYREIDGEFQQINYKDWVLPINPNNHNYKDYKVVAPTCTEQGYTIRKCMTNDNKYGCGKEIKYDDDGTTLHNAVPAKGHSSSAFILVSAPTCTNVGFEHRICINDGCGIELEKREIQQIPHSPTNFITFISPTCVTPGYNIKICSSCNINLYEAYNSETYSYSVTYDNKSSFKNNETLSVNETVYEDVAALGHDLVWKKDVAETCEHPAVINAYCTRSCCVPTQIFATSDTPTPATGHKASGVWVTTLAPTCEEDGTRVQYCNNPWCDKKGEYIVKSETIEKLGHDFTILVSTTYKTITNDATNGIKVETYKCSRCDRTNNVETTVSHDYIKTTYVQPTCTSDGQSKFTCKNCGYTYIATDLSLLGHEYYNVNTVKPTCEDRGYTNQKCSRCGATRIDPESYTNPLGHDFSGTPVYKAYTSTGLYSCGYLTYTCSRCPETVASEVGHSYEIYGDNVPPTCTEKGYSNYRCSKCFFIKKDSYVNALGHDYSVKVSTLNPTCTEGGNSTYKCSRCSSTTIKDYTNALGHTYNASQAQYTWSGQDANGATATCVGNNKCSRCSQAPISTTVTNIIPTKTNPTCVNTGSWNYTANFTQTGFSTQTTKTTISALGHTYNVNNTIHTWNGNTECTGENICTRCSNNEEGGKAVETVTTSVIRNIEPTCEGAGYYTYIADFKNSNLLDTSKRVDFGAGGHNYVEVRYDSDSTGHWIISQCTKCKSILNSSKSAHNYDVDQTKTAPTCTKTGEGYRVCKNCGYTQEFVISALGHNPGTYSYPKNIDLPSNYTKYNANTHILICKCNRQGCDEPDKILGTKNEAHELTSPGPTKYCTETNYETKHCKICDFNITISSDPLGHDFSVKGNTTNPTCENYGYTVYKCSRCDATTNADKTSPLGHNFDNGTYTSETGGSARQCKVLIKHCTREGCSSIQTISEHDMTYDNVAATCGASGHNSGRCNICGYSYYENIPATGQHTWVYVDETQPANCQTSGTKNYKCSVCKAIDRRETGIKGDHQYKLTKTISTTCTTDGIKEYTCSVTGCGTKYSTVYEQKYNHSSYHTEYGYYTRYFYSFYESEGIYSYSSNRAPETFTFNVNEQPQNYRLYAYIDWDYTTSPTTKTVEKDNRSDPSSSEFKSLVDADHEIYTNETFNMSEHYGYTISVARCTAAEHKGWWWLERKYNKYTYTYYVYQRYTRYREYSIRVEDSNTTWYSNQQSTDYSDITFNDYYYIASDSWDDDVTSDYCTRQLYAGTRRVCNICGEIIG